MIVLDCYFGKYSPYIEGISEYIVTSYNDLINLYEGAYDGTYDNIQIKQVSKIFELTIERFEMTQNELNPISPKIDVINSKLSFVGM